MKGRNTTKRSFYIFSLCILRINIYKYKVKDSRLIWKGEMYVCECMYVYKCVHVCRTSMSTLLLEGCLRECYIVVGKCEGAHVWSLLIVVKTREVLNYS